ncbi:MAG TPA: biopolymer transporter ExbD [Spirochaetota bacterium]|nr:biopolymer transporter ExbD [Spirochaetota bacterium]HOM09752.1 biopolymer transporter ExbD [Spirochaetota bacterium]HPP49348.1 biopolymer transporter ExbD [Spirochaetota bacterium]HXK65352.1 biopolymer transporter ExbD [Spirochaetota bacterium]
MYWFSRKNKPQQKQSRLIEFDTTPIADLSFNLLIFFIVTASFIIRQGVFLSLPSLSAGTVKVEPSQVIEIYPQDNGFIADGKALDRKALLQYLTVRKSQTKEAVSIIYMKPTIKYERLVDTLSAIRESGLSRISLKYNER